MPSMPVKASQSVSLLWFRKGLRIHDNPALHEALQAKRMLPVFCLDPWFLKPSTVGINRMQFLLDALTDLDASLQARGSKLILLQGPPQEQLPLFWRKHNVTDLIFESDTEPYGRKRDAAILALAEADELRVSSPVGHTLYDPEMLLARNKGKPPLTYKGFEKLVADVGPPPAPLADPPAKFPPPGAEALKDDTGIPSVYDIGGYSGPVSTHFKGGETVALARMAEQLSDTAWLAAFEKPKTNPASFEKPATTVLSPYLKFGCLSPRVFHAQLTEILSKSKTHTKPPVSLVGQLLWREFFYLVASSTKNYDQMKGNPICKQIDWDDNEEFFQAWDAGRTGFPWIDAIMTQLHEQGWIHHLARHAVACFLTRGDLYVNWERGRDTFDRLLIDADWSVNNGNWMWLSCSAFFYQYFRVYSPVRFGQQYDKEGKFIKRFIPALKNYPAKYIYEPWTASLADQKAWGCIIGKDYPSPIVDHTPQSKANMGRMKEAYSNASTAGDVKAVVKKPAAKKQKTAA